MSVFIYSCKPLLERIVHANIISHLEQCRVLNDEPHGIRKGRSCEIQHALSVNDLAKVSDRQNQASVIISCVGSSILATQFRIEIGSLDSKILVMFVRRRILDTEIDGSKSGCISIEQETKIALLRSTQL